MSRTRTHRALLRWGLCVAAAALAPAASAQTFEFVYTGTFSSADALNLDGAATTDFAGTTAFTATAFFNENSTNLAGPIGVPGFVAYSPLSATLSVAGKTYSFTTADQNPAQGVTVAIFDQNTPFGPGHYAAGFLQNPLADGAGFIGDWATASPNFSAGQLKSTTFTGYTGVGYGSGPTPAGGTVPTVVPILLTDNFGHTYDLTLGNYDEQAATSVENTATLNAVPEASSTVSFGLLLALFGSLALAARRKVRASQASAD